MRGSIGRLAHQAAGLSGALWVLGWTPLSAQRPVGDTLPAGRQLTLEEALQLSGPASEAVGIARAAVARARGEQLKARSEFFPQLTGSASYTRTLKSQFGSTSSTSSQPAGPSSCNRFTPDPLQPIATRLDSLESAVQCLSSVNPLAAFSNLPFGRKNQYRFGLSASQTLFAGGRIRALSRAAAAGRRSAEIGLTAAEAQLMLDITRTYYDAVLSNRLLTIAQATLDQTDTTLAQTRLARQVGNQPEFDLLRAQVTRDNQRPVVLQRRADRDIALLRLKQLLHLAPDQELLLTTDLADSTMDEVPTLASVLASPTDTATESRAPVRQAAQAVQAQEGLLTAARAQRFPALSLTSSYAKIAYPGSGLPGWDQFLTDWTIGIGLQVPIFTGGRIRGDVGVAQANLEESRLRLRQTEQLAQLDARSTRALLQEAEAAWTASQGTTQQAKRAYAIAEIRYREGISTQTELSDSRIQLQQAEANRALAARDLQVARVRMALIGDLPLDGGQAAGRAGGQQQSAPSPQQQTSGQSQAGQTGSFTP